MLVTVTNLSSTNQVYISSIQKTVAASGTVQFSRTPSELEDDVALKQQVVDGLISLSFAAEATDAVVVEQVPGLLAIRTPFTAGVTGAADDVTVFASNCPFAIRILDVLVYVSTANAGDTVTLRDAVAGGGNALSSAISVGVTGTARNAHTATTTVAKNGSIYIRRSDRDCAGEVIIFAVKV